MIATISIAIAKKPLNISSETTSSENSAAGATVVPPIPPANI